MGCGWRGPMSETLDRVRAGEEDPALPRVRRDPEVGDDQLRRESRAPTTSSARSIASAQATVFLALGTSLGVYPAAALPEIALRAGARLVIMNAEPTPFDRVADAVVREQLGEVLPALAALV